MSKGNSGDGDRLTKIGLVIGALSLLAAFVQTYIGWGSWKSPNAPKEPTPVKEHSIPSQPHEPITKTVEENGPQRSGPKTVPAPVAKIARPPLPRTQPSSDAKPTQQTAPAQVTKPIAETLAASDENEGSASVIDLTSPNLYFYLGGKKPSVNPAYSEGALLILTQGKWGYLSTPDKWAPGGWPVHRLGGNFSGKGSEVSLYLSEELRSEITNPFVRMSVPDEQGDSPWIRVYTKSATMYTLDPTRRSTDLPNGSYFAKGRKEPDYLKLEVTPGQVVLSANEGRSEVGRLSSEQGLIGVKTNERAYLGFIDKRTKTLYLFRISHDEGLARFCEAFEL